MSRRLPIVLLAIVVVGAVAIAYSVRARRAATGKPLKEVEIAQREVAAPREDAVAPLEQSVPAGNFIVALEKLGLTNVEAQTHLPPRNRCLIRGRFAQAIPLASGAP